MACAKGNLEIAKILLLFGADPNIMDDQRRTPLFYASRDGKTEIVEVLENYFPSLFDISLRHVVKFRIDISSGLFLIN